MRVTRENVAYFFWLSTCAAVALFGLFVGRLLGMPGEMTLFIGLPAILIMTVGSLFVATTAARLKRDFCEDASFLAAERTARIVQVCGAVLALAILVTEFFAANPLANALMILFGFAFYLQYLGYFVLVRRFG